MIYSDNQTKRIFSFCIRNVKFPDVQAGGTYSNHSALKD
jgi:hypothetical protein